MSEETEVQAELGAMISSLSGETKEEPKVEAKEEVKKEPIVEKREEIKDPPIKAKAEIEEEPPDEKDDTKEIEEEEEEEEIEEDKDKIISDLREKLAAKEVKKEEIKQEPKVEAKAEPKVEPFKVEEQDFVGGLDLDDLTSDPKELNKLLNKIYAKATTDARKGLEEGVLRSIPEIVRNSIIVNQEMVDISDQFYTENEDLKPFKKVVATVFEELAAGSTDKKYGEIVKLLGPEVRKRLDLHKKASSTVREFKKGDSPKLPNKGGKSGKIGDRPSINPIQSELEAMNKTLGR